MSSAFKIDLFHEWFSSFSIPKHKNQCEHKNLGLFKLLSIRVCILIYTGVDKLSKNREFHLVGTFRNSCQVSFPLLTLLCMGEGGVNLPPFRIFFNNFFLTQAKSLKFSDFKFLSFRHYVVKFHLKILTC